MFEGQSVRYGMEGQWAWHLDSRDRVLDFVDQRPHAASTARIADRQRGRKDTAGHQLGYNPRLLAHLYDPQAGCTRSGIAADLPTGAYRSLILEVHFQELEV